VANTIDHDAYADRTAGEIDRMAWITDGVDPAAPVPTCPGWTMSKLLKHTGTVHRWVTEIITTQATERVDSRALNLRLPEKESDYAGWLTDGAPGLAGALRIAGPDMAVWALGTEQTSGWWARRMLHETTVHRADAELASHIEPVIDAVVAADGIEEFLGNLPSRNLPSGNWPKPHLAELPTGKSLHLHGTDGDGEWLIQFTDAGIEWERGHAKATTAIRGPLTLLLLFVYGRVPASDERLTVFGDEELPALWPEKTAL
jgi:uncharacterized protein (TIGR03083 family)